jgi:hypothetical protein
LKQIVMIEEYNINIKKVGYDSGLSLEEAEG